MGTGIADPLVGRAREREMMAGALAGARGRPGGVLVVEGEPGIGKSRLLLELARIAGGRGAWCSMRARRSSSATCHTRCGATPSIGTSKNWIRVASGGSGSLTRARWRW